jgi:NAD(P)H-flavin reductase
VEQVGAEGARRRVDLYLGARSRHEFYDNEAIDKLAASYPWLSVTYVVGADFSRPGEFAHVVDRALADGDWRSRHVYICGSDEMVSHSVETLTRAGYHSGQLHHEGFGKHWYGPAWRAETAPDDSSGGAR